jgi:hypothetical protein
LLALPSVKNAHYAIAAQVPWAIWAALALARIGERLRLRGWNRSRLRAVTWVGFASLGLVYGACLWLIAPRLDRRGVEWGFYQSIGRALPSAMSLTFLYDDWDRLPYECAFGSFPHDLAVRLFYVGRPACWHLGTAALLEQNNSARCRAHTWLHSPQSVSSTGLQESDFVVVGRERDLPDLKRLGHVEIIARGPTIREDRSYSLFRISPKRENGRLSREARSRVIY